MQASFLVTSLLPASPGGSSAGMNASQGAASIGNFASTPTGAGSDTQPSFSSLLDRASQGEAATPNRPPPPPLQQGRPVRKRLEQQRPFPRNPKLKSVRKPNCPTQQVARPKMRATRRRSKMQPPVNTGWHRRWPNC